MDANVSFAIISLLISACLVLKAVDRSRDTSASLYKCLTGELVYRHDRCITKESAKLYGLAYALAAVSYTHLDVYKRQLWEDISNFQNLVLSKCVSRWKLERSIM